VVPSGLSFLYMAVRTLVKCGWRARGRAPLPLRPDLAMLARSIVTADDWETKSNLEWSYTLHKMLAGPGGSFMVKLTSRLGV
jgi:hypothetical protein